MCTVHHKVSECAAYGSSCTLACTIAGHAFQGEMEKMKKLLEDMKALKIYPGMYVYMTIIDSLSRGGHVQYIPEVSLCNTALQICLVHCLTNTSLWDKCCVNQCMVMSIRVHLVPGSSCLRNRASLLLQPTYLRVMECTCMRMACLTRGTLFNV